MNHPLCRVPAPESADFRGASRRRFLAGTASAAALFALRPSALYASPISMKARFHVSVIADEISQDFDHACSVIANDFGLQFVEVRDIGGKSPISLDSKDIEDARRILKKYNLRVTDIGSPLFKVDFKGAPLGKYSPKPGSAKYGFDQQNEVLERSIALARGLGTDRIRAFDFWRLDDQGPYREAMNETLRQASKRMAKDNLVFVLENEMSCNTATTAEAAKTLASVTNANFMLNWDPGNAVAAGELDVMPAYATLPKARIGHVHCKNAVIGEKGKSSWSPVDVGVTDWAAIFRALKRDGYSHAVSLETHWRGAGEGADKPEASTRVSFAGMEKELKLAGCIA